MAKKSLIDVAKHQNKLRAIVALNIAGASVFTDKTAMALNGKVSRSEFIEAFKADISKTATYLMDSLGIINSIKNGLIQELDTLDNSVESFFGKTYKDGAITLSGIDFIPGADTVTLRGEIVDGIYDSLFEIDRKELNVLSKTLTRYEEADSDIEKALLFPATILADKLIKKVGAINKNFNSYTKSMGFEEKQQFDSYFNRSGIEDVIQNSTFIDKEGVRQSVHKDLSTLSTLSESFKSNRFKYIEGVEIDGDADPKKVLNVINQLERLKINIDTKFVLKFRKLGNYKARGLYLNGMNIVAEDVRDSSALIHEVAHCVHLSNEKVFNSKFVNYMIGKLTARVDLANVPEEYKLEASKKEAYYTSSEEVIARALEIAALFANETSRVIWSDADFDLIKSRAHYEKYEGIYFNFNSFDNETKEEMMKLWELFYETTPDETISSNFDRFVKIDTNYRRAQKDINSLIKEASRLSEKKKRELYSLVNMANIDLIINNRPKTLSIKNLSLLLFQNISLWSGMSKRMTLSAWTNVIENEFTPIFFKLFNATKQELTNSEFIDFLMEFRTGLAFEGVDRLIGRQGFSLDFSSKLRSNLKDNAMYSEFMEFRKKLVRFGAIAFANDEKLQDLEFIKNFYLENHHYLKKIQESGLFSEDISFEICKYVYSLNKESVWIPSEFRKKLEAEEADKIESNIKKTNKAEKEPTLNKSINNNIENIVKEMEEKFSEELVEKRKEEAKKKILDGHKTVQEQIDHIKHLQKQEFEELLKKSSIEDFEHTKTGEKLKVLKVKERISNFKAFNEYLVKNQIAYYSRYAQGFIIKNLERVQVASATALSLYSADVIETFAKGSLF